MSSTPIISQLINLKCTACSKKYEIHRPINLCECGKVLFAVYNLEEAKETVTKESFCKRTRSIWRISEIMPVYEEKFRFTLGEGCTPLLHLKNMGENLGLKQLFVKDEGLNPTGTFKSRGLCAAVSKAVELGIKEFVIPTAGNAGAALAAYSARAKAKAHIFMPVNTPEIIKKEILATGGDLRLVDGIISDAAKEARKEAEKSEWFNMSTLKEPYRVEGKKTMGLELAETFNWELPDVIIYPTGGGTGIVGMWKAFTELEEIGLIGSERPRMISVQSSGCAPIVKAFEEKKDKASFWEGAETIAPGLKVPEAIGDYLILKAVRVSKGTAISVQDEEIMTAMYELAKKEGIMLSTEGAATIAAIPKLLNKGEIEKEDKIVVFGTGSGFTTISLW